MTVTPRPAAPPPRMRALVLEGASFARLSVKNVPTPRPGPRQLLARVDAAGICTSLIKLIAQGPEHKYLYGWDIERYPLILGDEGSVTVVEVGSELGDAYRAGQRFVVQPAVDHEPINHRERYRDNGRGVQKIAVGYTIGGNLAEYILVPEEVLEAACLVPLPDDSIPHSHAAMAEPLSCVISGQDHHVHLTESGPMSERGVIRGLRPGGLVVVVGAGAMGRMHVDLAMSYRPRAVLVTDLIDERLERVKKLFGARAEELSIRLITANSSVTDVAALVAELSDHRGADDVIVAVGVGKAIEIAQHYCGRGAVLNLFGGLSKGHDVIDLDTGIVHYRETIVTGSSGGLPLDVARALELMRAGELQVGAHITRIGDLEHAVRFLEMVRAQAIDGKAVVYPHRRSDRILEVDSWSASDEARYLAGERA